MTHNLSVNGKSGKTSYNIGLGYLDQSGMSKRLRKMTSNDTMLRLVLLQKSISILL